MADYTIRVEMHGASPELYDELHRRMEAGGCTRELIDGRGQAWYMPEAEYNLVNASADAAMVCEYFKKIADGVKRNSWVLVTQATVRAWNYN